MTRQYTRQEKIIPDSLISGDRVRYMAGRYMGESGVIEARCFGTLEAYEVRLTSGLHIVSVPATLLRLTDDAEWERRRPAALVKWGAA